MGTFWMLWAFVLTSLTYFLGAAPLRAVRLQVGRAFYWLSSLVLAGLTFGLHLTGWVESSQFLIWMAGSFVSLVMLVGLFVEFEESGHSFEWCAAASLLIMSCISVGTLGIVFWMTGPTLFNSLKTVLSESLKQARLEVPLDQMLFQIPSVVLVLWMLALYIGVLLESRIRIGPHKPSLFRAELFHFRAPAWMVWVFIVSLLPALGGHGPQWVQSVFANVLNFSIAVFFFQGLGVIHQVMIFLRISLFWQVLLALFLAVQLFMVVSGLGLVDYWLDLRSKLIKWRQSRLETYKRREK